MKLLLFVSHNCPHCPKAERVASEVVPDYAGLDYRKIRIKTEEGKSLSSEYHIMGTPTMLFLDGNGSELKRIVGVPGETGLRNTVEQLLGLRKSFLKRIFRKE